MSKLRSELTNLLPRSYAKALRREYFVRLVVLAFGFGTAAMIIHGLLLFPSYLYAHGEVSRLQAELEQASSSVASEEDRQVNERIEAVRSDSAYLARLGTLPTASSAVRAVLAVPHPGITISGFTFTAANTTSPQPQMTVTGTAGARDALRAYVSSLGQLPYVSNADLPISAYAKERDIPFTITLTGSLRP